MFGNLKENEIIGVVYDCIDVVWLIFVKCVWVILEYGQKFVEVFEYIKVFEEVMIVEIVNVLVVFQVVEW